MKNEIAKYVDKCLVCQKAKAKHQWLVGGLWSLEIPTWKWDSISIHFIIGLPLLALKRMSFGWSSIGSLNRPIFFPYEMHWMLKNYFNYMSRRSFDCMESQKTYYEIGTRDFKFDYYKCYKRPLEPNWILTALIILRLMNKLSKSIKFYRTCWEPVC